MKKLLITICLASVLGVPMKADASETGCYVTVCYEECHWDPILGYVCYMVCYEEWRDPCPHPKGIVDLWGGCGLIFPRNEILIRFTKLNNIIGKGALAPLDGFPQGRSVPLPDPLLSIPDARLTLIWRPNPAGDGTTEIYANSAPLAVDFGTREVDRNGNGKIEDKLGETGALKLQIPARAEFLVTTFRDGTIKIALNRLAGGDAFYTFVPDAGPDEGHTLEIPTDGRITFKLNHSRAGSTWTIKAKGQFPGIFSGNPK